MSWEHVVNAAQLAWDIVKDGKPSTQIETNTCNAVPDVQDWHSLTNAQGPTWVGRSLLWENLLTIDVVELQFRVNWEYGARYNGGGAYISNCWVTVIKCNVAWGFDVDLRMQVHNPTNAGTATAPKARLPLTISGTVSSLANSRMLSWDYTLFGDGTHQASH